MVVTSFEFVANYYGDNTFVIDLHHGNFSNDLNHVYLPKFDTKILFDFLEEYYLKVGSQIVVRVPKDVFHYLPSVVKDDVEYIDLFGLFSEQLPVKSAKYMKVQLGFKYTYVDQSTLTTEKVERKVFKFDNYDLQYDMAYGYHPDAFETVVDTKVTGEIKFKLYYSLSDVNINKEYIYIIPVFCWSALEFETHDYLKRVEEKYESLGLFTVKHQDIQTDSKLPVMHFDEHIYVPNLLVVKDGMAGLVFKL